MVQGSMIFMNVNTLEKKSFVDITKFYAVFLVNSRKCSNFATFYSLTYCDYGKNQ
jgi:hypothetical protein